MCGFPVWGVCVLVVSEYVWVSCVWVLVMSEYVWVSCVGCVCAGCE